MRNRITGFYIDQLSKSKFKVYAWINHVYTSRKYSVKNKQQAMVMFKHDYGIYN